MIFYFKKKFVFLNKMFLIKYLIYYECIITE